ncbi:ketoacyl-ACP synthase III [Thiomicrorhabdus sp. Milos-T2]|uniref:ketoacyl-ACP synthase III n=1 Tax=Thiomicrorhabdus sp. Milos-T2 TaxID=90814 RepID=UPI00049427BD|nr:ketoacyl-ACP synthase III [Thiomicrorhabdus sp. Milos-T2]
MVAITHVGTYLPEKKVSNLEFLEKFETDESFIRNKIGVVSRARKEKEEKASDLCIKAYENLNSKTQIQVADIECCVVVTQNPDFNIPHTSAIVHGAIGLPETCACFDISLGCSGYVYGLSVISAFMQANGMSKGLLFTADPYSDIIDENDKNTALIFGDGATVTLLEQNQPGLVPLGFDFGSKGKGYKNLINEEKLFMNGRAVFNFTAATVPISVNKLLDKLDLTKEDIDRWYLHQGSKYIVDTISNRLGLDQEKVVFDMYEYGNTVSSSIPLLLSKDIETIKTGQKIGLSGFGVGLSWASMVLQKMNS